MLSSTTVATNVKYCFFRRILISRFPYVEIRYILISRIFQLIL